MAQRKKTPRKKVTKKKAPTKKTTRKKAPRKKAPVKQKAAGAKRPKWKASAAANKKMTQRSTKFFKLPAGTTTLRVLPQFDGSESIFAASFLHYKVQTEDGQRNIAPACLNEHGGDGDSCYICKFIDWMKENGDDLMYEIADNLYAGVNLNVQAWVWDKIGKAWYGPKIVRLPKSVGDALSDMMSVAEDNDMPFFCDPEKGQGVAVTKTGEGKGTRYTCQPTSKFENLSKLVPDWEDKAYMDLWKELDVQILDPDEQKQALFRTWPDLPWDQIDAADEDW